MKPRFSSSTQLAALFSSLIGIAAVFTLYQMYNLGKEGSDASFLLKVTLILLLFICIGLFTVSHYVTQRLMVISGTARNIMLTGDISQRIPVDRRSDDLIALSGVLNDMLDEIERLMLGIRTVTDNIAHDLRHPLTRLRNHMEELHEESIRSDGRIAPEKLTPLIDECDNLLGTFSALLRISNIESGKRHAAFEQVNIERLLSDIVELYEPLAQEKNIQLFFKPMPAVIVGDKDLLFQALTNLVDNAIKYTSPGGTVEIRIFTNQHRVHVEIEDEGPGIPLSERRQVFQRFYRIDSSRNTPGNGLGLSLVKAVLDMHKASIGLNTSRRGGLAVSILF